METHFTTHAESRTDAVQILITDPIEATGVVTDAAAEYDLDALADALLTYHPSSRTYSLAPQYTVSPRSSRAIRSSAAVRVSAGR